MVKKGIVSIILGMAMLYVFSVSVSAFSWAQYYNNDSRFPMIWGHTRVATFIDRTSIAVQRYDPPYYIIAVKVFYAPDGGYGDMMGCHTERFYYNYDITKMYMDKKAGTNDWIYLYPTYHDTVNSENKTVGEAAFYLAYHMKFYGAYRWKDIQFPDSNYEDVFSDDFYRNLQ